MSPQHKSAMLYAQAADLHRSGQRDAARTAYRKAKAIEDSLKTRSCHWCGDKATCALIDDSPQYVDYACPICAEIHAHAYDRDEALPIVA